jgi:hypothetical protein
VGRISPGATTMRTKPTAANLPTTGNRQNIMLFLGYGRMGAPAAPKSKRRWPARPAGPARVISLAARLTPPASPTTENQR